MKKNVILGLICLMLLIFTCSTFAEDKHILTLKVGVNSGGLEYEKLSPNGTGLFINEVYYTRRHPGDIDDWFTYGSYTTILGLRKHASTSGNHLFFSLGGGISGIDPLVDASVGYEYHLDALPESLYLRGEGGVSLIYDIGYGLEPKIHAGVGLSWEFDSDLLRFF